MTIQTTFSGYVRRYNGDVVVSQHRFSSSKDVTEYAQSKITLASSASGVSIMPRGLQKATSVFLETTNKVNVTLFGRMNASFDLMASGDFFLNGSISDVKLKSSGISTGSTNITFDISG